MLSRRHIDIFTTPNAFVRRSLLLSLFPFAVLAGCADEPVDKTDSVPLTLAGKADATEWMTAKGPLRFGADAAVTGRFEARDAFFGYELDVRPGAKVTLDVTRKGSASKLDTMLYVFGPVRPDGTWQDRDVAQDDDSGYSRLSKLSGLTLAEGGRYIVVLTTYNGRGRGAYRLQADCLSGDCAPLPTGTGGACHPAIEAAIRSCYDGWMQDPDRDPQTMPSDEVMRQCADAEIVAPAWDSLCLVDSPDLSVCNTDLENFSYTQLPVCRHALVSEVLDSLCIFGSTYRESFNRTAPLVVQWQRELTAADIVELSATERLQIVKAVKQTAYNEVTTVEDCFSFVDEGVVNQSWLWDASGRRQFVVYEVGAGDNSFGAYFPVDSDVPAALINDSDVGDCAVGWGPERRWCSDKEPCADGVTCNGRDERQGSGLCLDASKDNIPGNGDSCGADTECGSGLVCAGSALGGEGLCNPAWMRGYFGTRPGMPIPDGPTGKTEVKLTVAGLATVSTDVRIDLYITHQRVSDLKITLINPSGTRGIVFDGERNGTEIHLRGEAVGGFPGDESVNGEWTLEVVDRNRNKTGTVQEVALIPTSRWD